MNSFVENVRKKIEAKRKGPKDPNKKTRGKRSKKAVRQVEEDNEPGTVFVSHLPHGFYEKNLERYFSQFGKVLKVRVARSKKSGRPKGFAYIKFLRAVLREEVLSSDLHRKKVNAKRSEESLVRSKIRKLDRLSKLKKSLKNKGIQFKVKPFTTKDA
ncbi:hypothetical protein JTE90_009348 [Oedothorax gibbosus]|uniref:RRM domain-containing protein n=1 Tax=Oedothorax gibbosus TaxID=931172 RepID=A0AAV6VUQ3_9ARAC|nr:hypothetical protein JTE90_009348 [Oedothorax gibbosus]